MLEKERSIKYAVKRLQAQTNARDHVNEILFSSAKRILGASKDFIGSDGILLDEKKLRSLAKDIALDSGNLIRSYTEKYCRASMKVLGSDTDAVSGILDDERFGRTFMERNDEYMAGFADDVVNLIKAGVHMGYNEEKILSAMRTGYQDPYVNSMITKANRGGTFIETPSYGRGKMHASYANILRNVQDTISYAWGIEEGADASSRGAIGFTVHRCSSYPCAVCDDQCGYVHKMGDQLPPYHNRCVCRVEFIFKK